MDNFCFNCGSLLDKEASFCLKCGTKVNLGKKDMNTLVKLARKVRAQNDNKYLSGKPSKRYTGKDNENESDKKAEDKVLIIVSKLVADMVNCPSGSFIMGSKAPLNPKVTTRDGELGRYDDEIQHKVIFTKSFKIGKYPITQIEYAAVMGKNPSKFKGVFRPVESVSWYEAKAFCKKLNTKYPEFLPSGYRFDLPTEAQWEYACRAGTTASLNNNKDLTTTNGFCENLDEVGWYNKNSNGKTHPVGRKRPNAWGVYDMHGNVWEWCRDYYGDYVETDEKDPLGAFEGSYRVLRGGSWHFKALGCRSAIRNRNFPDKKSNRIGFRLAIVPIK